MRPRVEVAIGRKRGSVLALAVSVLASPALTSPIEQSELAVTERSVGAMAGRFGRGASLVDFSARALGAGRYGVRLDVNGLILEVESDERQALISGRGLALDVPDKEVLIAFAGVLESLFAGGTQAARHEDELLRAARLFSEAPVGFPIEPHVIVRPEEVYDSPTENTPSLPSPHQPQGVAPESVTSLSSHGEVSTMCACTRWVNGQCCEYAADDGILPIPGVCTARNCCSEYHDAYPIHCYGWSYVRCGNYYYSAPGCSWPNPNQCNGRCGSGCGWQCVGAYNSDCLDHDSCCGYHGGCFDPFGSHVYCGDEWNDAKNDFKWGTINCTSCRS